MIRETDKSPGRSCEFFPLIKGLVVELVLVSNIYLCILFLSLSGLLNGSQFITS